MCKIMKAFLFFGFLVLASWIHAMMPKQNIVACYLLCDESVDKMQACVVNDSICFLFTSDSSPFFVIDPSKMKKIKVESLQKEGVKVKMDMYCERYSERITGVFFVELKDGYQLPNSLFKNRVIDSIDR